MNKIKEAVIPEMLSTKEAAEALRLSSKTLYQWYITGEGPIKGVRPLYLKKILWRKSDIIALLNGENQ